MSAPLTHELAGFIATFRPERLPPAVRAQNRVLIRDGAATLLAAANPDFSTGRRIAAFVRDLAGAPEAHVVGHGFRTDAASAALANGTMGYACDFEPHHPEAVLHPIAVMIPAALAAAEVAKASGAAFSAAVALGCEVEYRVAMALDPMGLYEFGFHPSAVCGAFGAAAASSFLLGLDADGTERALGLAACQASGLAAWQSDPTENARPFQMGVAARNGVTAALLARGGFGGPRGIFDHGHTVFRAFTARPRPHLLTADLGTRWEGVMGLAIKPYSCVSETHPALDALFELVRDEGLTADAVERIVLHFARSIIHCIDGNPLKSHCAQYILPVALVNGDITVADLFFDRRDTDPRIAALSRRVTVVADDGELEALFPAKYATILEVETKDGRTLRRRNDQALGYPETPMSEARLLDKARALFSTVAAPAGVEALLAAIDGLADAPSVASFARLMGAAPDA